MATRDMGPLVGQMALQAGVSLAAALSNRSPHLDSDIIVLVRPRIIAEKDPKNVLIAAVTLKPDDQEVIGHMLEGAYERVMSGGPQMSGEVDFIVG